MKMSFKSDKFLFRKWGGWVEGCECNGRLETNAISSRIELAGQSIENAYARSHQKSIEFSCDSIRLGWIPITSTNSMGISVETRNSKHNAN